MVIGVSFCSSMRARQPPIGRSSSAASSTRPSELEIAGSRKPICAAEIEHAVRRGVRDHDHIVAVKDGGRAGFADVGGQAFDRRLQNVGDGIRRQIGARQRQDPRRQPEQPAVGFGKAEMHQGMQRPPHRGARQVDELAISLSVSCRRSRLKTCMMRKPRASASRNSGPPVATATLLGQAFASDAAFVVYL